MVAAERSEGGIREAGAVHIRRGSHWFWWYGDDHSSDQDAEFDDLFRRHVRNAYAALGLEPPAELFKTNISTAPAVDAAGAMTKVDA